MKNNIYQQDENTSLRRTLITKMVDQNEFSQAK